MSNKIQIKRGDLSDIPILSVGEFGFTTDVEQLYIGTGSLNLKILTSDDQYIHPTYTARTESGDTTALTGATVISDLDFNVSSDAFGHITACDITTLATRDLTLANLGYTGETNAQANVATNMSWTAGTTSGPICNSSTGSDSAIPVASASASGAVNTTTQTFAGAKTFSSPVNAPSFVTSNWTIDQNTDGSLGFFYN